MDTPNRRNRAERRGIDKRYNTALRAHNRRVQLELDKRYGLLGDAEFRRKQNLPDVLPEPARRALAEAWAHSRIGPQMPRRADFV